MELFTQLFGDVLAFVYHCFDRIVIYGYLSGLSRPEQVVHFFRDVVGVAVVSKDVLSQRTADYQAWVEAYARNHRLPLEWAEKGVRKEDHVLPWQRRMVKRGTYGVYFIFKSMEQGATFRVTVPKYPTKDPNYRILAHQRSRFTHYYFYIRDEVLGPIVMRVASLAEPNAVLIDENTWRLIGRLFEYRNLGMVEARGFAGTVSAWQVVRPSSVASRFEALRASSPTPLVGRGEELEFLLRRRERARKGEGQVVLLSGEPGIGKSRMTAAVAERLREEPHYHWRYFCAPHHQGTALHPVITQLEHAAGFARDDPSAAKLEKLRQLFGQGRLGHLRRRVAAHAGQRSRNSEQEAERLLLAVAGVRQALVAELLSLSAAGTLPEMNLSPQRKKEKTLEALLGLLEDLSRKRPVLMVFEDVHWIDPTSRELLDLTPLTTPRR